MPTELSIAQQLCTNCGLCCNGVIFRDVELNPADASRLKGLGLPLRKSGKKVVMNQPCAALDCSLCKIYSERPNYCREFECALLKGAQAGTITAELAQKNIRSALKKAEKVKRLLRDAGNHDERFSLSKRFKRVSRAFESGELPGEANASYGDLMMAVHDLNYLLSTEFYPGSSEDS